MLKRTLTSGDIARYCDVNIRTAIRWLEKGHIKAYKHPGRGDNRVQVDDFLSFLKKQNMPVPVELQQHSAIRVLIVDDEQAMVHSIKRILRGKKYETKVVTNGFEAGAFLGEFKPHVMTLDLSMPGLDGFSVIRFAKKSKSYQHIKILVVSALPLIELNRALEAGADGVLEKPFASKELVEKIIELSGYQSFSQ